jgi:cysteine-rich repeat protein
MMVLQYGKQKCSLKYFNVGRPIKSILDDFDQTGLTEPISDMWTNFEAFGVDPVTGDFWGDGRRNNSLSTYCDDGNNEDNDGCNSIWQIEEFCVCSEGSIDAPDVCVAICGDGRKIMDEEWDDGNLNIGDGCDLNWKPELGWIWIGGSVDGRDIWIEVWGDGIRFNSNPDYCDDENTKDNDGWSSTCSVEDHYSCSGGTIDSPDICTPICGDGRRLLGEECDDGNLNNGDGCDSNCKTEVGWMCAGGSVDNADIWKEVWGDGIRFNSNSNYCDDGNTKNGDGWSSNCFVENHYSCSEGKNDRPDICIPICGDGSKIQGEECDDGNLNNGDGWDLNCKNEEGWSWIGGSIDIADIWTEIWGDGIKFNSNSNYCDDGNSENGDGWSSNCSVENFYTCSGGKNNTPDICIPICGDGRRLFGEECDDGNLNNGDGCDSNCKAEVGWMWAGGSVDVTDIWKEVWGDGIRFNFVLDYCDDGNNKDDDGCSSICSIEPGWTCKNGTSSTPDICYTTWGDGLRTGVEEWDDANTIEGDGWSSDCLEELGWECSGGTFFSQDSWTESWGDGRRFNSNDTYCDDRNNLNGDGWSEYWEVEEGYKWYGGSEVSQDKWEPICGDGKTFFPETWDDGNLNNEDGWNSDCQIESGWNCSSRQENQSYCSEICGDGRKFNRVKAYWDDGNLNDQDGCNHKCKIEVNYNWNGGNSSQPDVCIKFDGDLSIGGIPMMKVSSASETTQTAIFGLAGITVALSFTNSSSLSSLWSIINQLQILILLILIKGYVSDNAKLYLTNQRFALVTINFYGDSSEDGFFDSLASEQEDEDLKSIGVLTSSAFVNILSILMIVIPVVWFHILLILLKSKNLKQSENKMVRKYFLLRKKLHNILKCNFYVRISLLWNESFLLSSTSEIRHFIKRLIGDPSSPTTLEFISFVLAILILTCCLLLIFISIKDYIKVREKNEIDKTYLFISFYSYQKKNKWARMFTSALLVRRALFWIIVISLLGRDSKTLVFCLLLFIQVIYLGQLAIIRPFEPLKVNLVEIINEVFILIFIFIFFMVGGGRYEDSNSTVVTLVILGIVINAIILALIETGTLLP